MFVLTYICNECFCKVLILLIFFFEGGTNVIYIVNSVCNTMYTCNEGWQLPCPSSASCEIESFLPATTTVKSTC